MSQVIVSVRATQRPHATDGDPGESFGWKSWTKIRFDGSSVSSLPVRNREFQRLRLSLILVYGSSPRFFSSMHFTSSIAARIPCTFLRTTYPIVPFCQNCVPQIESASLHACILSIEGFECQARKNWKLLLTAASPGSPELLTDWASG